MKPLVSFVLATCNRQDLLVNAIDSILEQEYPNFEIVVISNGSTDGTRDLFIDDGEYNLDNIAFYHYEEQLGVAEARNVGYRKATGEILVTLDDDARFNNLDATENIVFEFESNSELGILSFKIVNYYTQAVEDSKIPTRDDNRSANESFECAYFLGGGNAIRAEVFEKVGYYPSDFEYSFEELDLSYRAFDEGFRIKYVPSVVVIHEADPKSEGVERDTLEQYLTNRIKVAVRNLPWRYVIVSSVIWTGYTLLQAKFDPRPLIGALETVLKNQDEIMSNRSVISYASLKEIQKMGGRTWI